MISNRSKRYHQRCPIGRFERGAFYRQLRRTARCQQSCMERVSTKTSQNASTDTDKPVKVRPLAPQCFPCRMDRCWEKFGYCVFPKFARSIMYWLDAVIIASISGDMERLLARCLKNIFSSAVMPSDLAITGIKLAFCARIFIAETSSSFTLKVVFDQVYVTRYISLIMPPQRTRGRSAQ